VEALARIATLVEQTREENPGMPVVYVDAGDSEESSIRLSNLTKGVAMHQLLEFAGCAAATIGNGGLHRYSQTILKDYAQAVHYPHLLANLRNLDGSLFEGAQATALLQVGNIKLGLIGVTATIGFDQNPLYDNLYEVQSLPSFPLIHELTADLRTQGADVVVLLSHLGLPDDIMASFEIQESIPIIISAHTHHLAPAGIWSGKTLIASTGAFGTHLGRLDLRWDGEKLHIEKVTVIPLSDDVPQHEGFQEKLAEIEADVAARLQTVVGYLEEPLELAYDRPCAAASLVAEALRKRADAEIGLVTAGNAFKAGLPAGPLTRLALWEACPSPAKPCVTNLTGEQLTLMVRRGNDVELAMDAPRILRFRPRGLLNLSGAVWRDGQLFVGEQPVEPGRRYKVAMTDWEMSTYAKLREPDWQLALSIERQTIVRDVVEEHLQGKLTNGLVIE
jgi:2',3'-cyclic-nucleotide 2'-phosphodiesterase (5'-nucleotidase family)